MKLVVVFVMVSAALLASCGEGPDERSEPSAIAHPITGVIPGGRSANMGARQQRFKDALTKAGINFTVSSFEGREYVVWDFKDTEAVITAWSFNPEQIKMFRAHRDEWK